jgi:hypothetical protein
MSDKYVSDKEFALVTSIPAERARELFKGLKGAAYVRKRDGCYVTRKTSAVKLAEKNRIRLPLPIEQQWRTKVKESK